MADFTWYLNRQGPRGNKGEKGDPGNDGLTPTFSTGVNTGTTYTLVIDSGDGNTFETPNLMPTFTYQNGTYLRYDMANDRYVAAPADKAKDGGYGEVILATDEDEAEDTDAVSFGLLQDYVENHGGGGGVSFTTGNAIELTSQNVLNVKIDNDTVQVNQNNELEVPGFDEVASAVEAIVDGESDIFDDYYTKTEVDQLIQTGGQFTTGNGVDLTGGVLSAKVDGTTISFDNSGNLTVIGGGGGGGTTYTAGNGIEISSANVISTKVDGTSIGINASGQLEFINGAGYITSAALSGYATQTWVGNQGYLTSISSSDVTTALGYTPYSASNPDGYTSNVGTVTSVNNTNPDSNGNVTLSIPDISHMVTDNTAQTISAKKTFNDDIVINGTKCIYYKNSSNNECLMIGKVSSNVQGFGHINVGYVQDALKLVGKNARPTYTPNGGTETNIALYSDIPGTMTGASAGYAGTSGLVPTPAAGDNEKFLCGDGTWQTVSGGGGTTYTATSPIEITSNDISISYDSSTLDVANGALKVKDDTFITETSLETVHCVIETSQTNLLPSWYRLYDDGWVEQGGINNTAGSTIFFLKSFVNSNYTLPIEHTNKTTTSFTMTNTGDWFAAGFEGV